MISEEPTYDIVKQKFIEHYGANQKEWPFFIQEIKRLTTQYQLYNAEQASPHEQHYHTFFNKELGGGGENPKSDFKFGSKHLNSTRNYFSFFHYYYPGILNEYGKIDLGDSEWQKMLQKKDELTPLQQSYINASKTDGILAAIFYMYASYCPVNLLDWHFNEVFPFINLLYSQENKEGLIALLEAVQTQIKSYCDNLEFRKAYVYNDVAYRFAYYYDRVPGYSARLPYYELRDDAKNIKNLERGVRERFDTVFRAKYGGGFRRKIF